MLTLTKYYNLLLHYRYYFQLGSGSKVYLNNESTYYFAETVSVRCRLIVLQRRRASIRFPRLAVDDFNHTVTR